MLAPQRSMVRPGKQKEGIGSVVKRFFPQTQRMFSQIATSMGLVSSERQRTVRFQQQAAVYEFERQLLGGGGVPDGDTVALGLGPKCVPSSAGDGSISFSARAFLALISLAQMSCSLTQVRQLLRRPARRQGGQG